LRPITSAAGTAGQEMMMDQVLSDPRHVESLAKAIAREVLRELVHSPGFEAIVEPIRHNGVFSVGPLTVDTLRHEAMLHGEALQLKPREFALLAFLARNPGRAFTREQILDLVWPESVACAIDSERTIDVHVRRIRVKLGSEAKRLARTIVGVGYKLQPP
jgi:DNA-binding response OmpR family regulator